MEEWRVEGMEKRRKERRVLTVFYKNLLDFSLSKI